MPGRYWHSVMHRATNGRGRIASRAVPPLAATLLLLGALESWAAPEDRSAPPRNALLVANGAYLSFPGLANPLPEARLLGDTLRALGFSVTLVENVGREGMLDALSDFEAAVRRGGGIALFHYGGHGVQVEGKNYLIPVDADIPDERRVATRALDVDEIMAMLDASGAETSIVILDACRNNPLPAAGSRSTDRGLGVMRVRPRNSIIIYAAESGTAAIDGVFTPTLVKHLARPGLSLAEVMTEVRREVFTRTNGGQTPGEYSQLFEQVYLAGRPTVAGEASSSPSFGTVSAATGGLSVSLAGAAGMVNVLGRSVEIPAGGMLPLEDVPAGEIVVSVRYEDGTTDARKAVVEAGRTTSIVFGKQEPVYKVGDRGPAGGIVFHDKGRSSDGWRYLEAAPGDQASSIPWGGSGTKIGGTDMVVGAGEANTRAIVERLGADAAAARVCDDMVLGGFDDWFLPSKEELVLLHGQRALVGGFKGYYWSSTEDGADNAWDLTFTNGYQYSSPKTRYRAVRAIRAF